jgi:hypothetical protein
VADSIAIHGWQVGLLVGQIWAQFRVVYQRWPGVFLISMATLHNFVSIVSIVATLVSIASGSAAVWTTFKESKAKPGA